MACECIASAYYNHGLKTMNKRESDWKKQRGKRIEANTRLWFVYYYVNN